MQRSCQSAEEIDCFPSVPRGLIHSDLAWSNIISTANGGVALVDFEGAGVGPPVIDLVETTTYYLVHGPSGSGALRAQDARAFYTGYRERRHLSADEIASFQAAHMYHQLYYLADSLGREDFCFVRRYLFSVK